MGSQQFMGSNLHISIDKLYVMDKMEHYGKTITIGI